jgi:hypothetical protein
MRKTNRTIASAVAALGVVLLAPCGDAFAARAGPRPANPPAAPAAPGGGAAKPADPGATVNDPRGDPELSKACLEVATEKLRFEYAASLRDPRAKLREQSSYFIEQPVQLHPAALVTALEKAGDRDLRLATYVRWQLLSGAPAAGWDKPLAARVAELYRRAPVPTSRFGLSAADQRKLDAKLAATKREEAMRLSDMIDDQLVKDAEANRLTFAYRDALYATFPPGYERFAGGLRDAFERLGYGWPPKELMKRIEDEMTQWASSGAGDPRQYAALGQLVFRLRSERSPRYYVAVGTSRTTKQPYWMTRTDALYEAKNLADLQKLLEEKGNVRRPTLDGAAAGR